MNRERFFAVIRPYMPTGRLTSIQVKRIEAVLNGIAARRLEANKAAYVLATAHHESDAWRTLQEYASGAAYEGRKDLGNTVAGDGVRFKGRGLVQITGRKNYADWGTRLKLPLTAKPELAAELRYAVDILIDGMILGTFTGKKLADYFTETKSDWLRARKIINGTDKASMIAGHAIKFLEALNA